MASDDYEDFDWAAAVAEIDKACSRIGGTERGGAEPSSTQSRAFHQKTLDSFVRGGGVNPRSNVTEVRVQHGNGRVLDPPCLGRAGNQRFTGTGFSAQQVSSGGDEASGSGCRLPLDLDAAKIWIYPANVPRRSYQFNITKSALFCNTLVCLPTGLGKTLIAAVVMYNYFRWFPTGKIVFTAPSRPLVVQQIEACHKVTGIPQNMTIDMTGQMNPQIRAEHWQSKRVFFVTPQVLEKDIQAGRCATKQLVCLVVDEAHRATGNYSYCVVVRELLAANVEPRILALTATPGSKQITIQAVVDNLQISCLEYRDEHDPDVCQYTHDRKIELIEVAMNAESTQVKDVFIEVLQPVVQRLCYLGVFYSREISRLTAYEVLTARDKFRQAPPPTLQQHKYQEVETYFGLAITLFHIFKLLITHGMRPAFEMLRKKLQQGVLKRLAKNEKLCQVQELMKQSIGHGAPSPKLEKVVDIINGHFSAHDATKTRVIIFTNFRESVKDIMEKLAAACATAKAMEFIGQSSGTTSKGQTQKMQQAVLQRFRGGCYNTIVATSIAEEGLDIMEVDLVICFDANISPLRMIQRMGRTGRKRDGRVVVLASGGSEIQGYLKKQSKSKVLGKHMLNGGLQSFNFHPSHHMIPHSLRTTVQVVELAIEDFVPRGRKLKEKDSETGVGGRRKLTERELETINLFKDIPSMKPHLQSEWADPSEEFFAGPVHQVKHSKRCCMLIDVLQTGGAPVCGTGEEKCSGEKITSPWEIEVPEQNISPVAVDEICMLTSSPCAEANLEIDDCAPRLDHQELESVATRYVLPRPAFTEGLSATVHAKDPPLQKEPMGGQQHHEPVGAGTTVSSSPLHALNETDRSVFSSYGIEEEHGDYNEWEYPPLTPKAQEGFNTDHKLSGDAKAKEDAQVEIQYRSSFPSSDDPGVNYHETLGQRLGTGFHRCRFSSGVVSVTQSGSVLIASPPSLLLSRKLAAKGLAIPSDRSANTGISSIKTVSSGRAEHMKTVDFCAFPSVSENHSYAAVTPVHHVGRAHLKKDFIAETPYEKTVHSSPKEARQPIQAFQGRSFGPEELSPRLAEFANHGIVPSSPLMSIQSVCGQVLGNKGHHCPPSENQPHTSPMHSALINQKSLGASDSLVPSSPMHCNSGLQKPPVSSFSRYAAPRSPPQPRAFEGAKPRNLGFSCLEDTGRQLPQDQSTPVVNNGRNSSIPDKNLQASGDHSETPNKSPLQILSCKSSTEEWQINGGEASGSVRRPLKLKRLRRACEKVPAFTSETSVKRCQDQVKSKVHLSRSGREKNERKLAARMFIDEEAEISSDDGLSEEDGCEDEDEESLEGFIDTAATQHLNGSVNMMAVYRKSLLTPSPLSYPSAKQMDPQQQHSIHSSDFSASSVERSSASGSVEDVTPGLSVSPYVNTTSLLAHPHNGVRRTPVIDLEIDVTTNREDSRGGIVTNTALGAEVEILEGRKPEIRKRKLSFQMSPSFEDDLFEGVDWDALEAEATELSRSRAQETIDQDGRHFQVLSKRRGPDDEGPSPTFASSKLHKGILQTHDVGPSENLQGYWVFIREEQ